MSQNISNEHKVLEKTEQHLSLIRWLFLLFLATIDALYKDNFDFPLEVYVLTVCVILGLDARKLVRLIKGIL